MATKTITPTKIDNSWETITSIPMASGDIVQISGYKNVNDIVIIAKPATTSGYFTINAGDYDNKKDNASESFSGIYKAITNLDGNEIEQRPNMVEITVFNSGDIFAFYK